MKQKFLAFSFCLVELTAWCLEGNYSAHDPSRIVRDGATYWIFATGRGILSRFSSDRVNWQAGPAVFSALPAWVNVAVPGNNGDAWAPDVLYFNGRFNVYYSVSTFGQNDSVIGLVTSPTLNPADPNYQWTDQGAIIESNPGDNFNAIDPALTRDASGNLWMVFGSFWSGIKLIPLDATGKRLGTAMYSLASRASTANEGAYIHYRDGSYYLFVSWDQCCAGTNSTYYVRVGRSPNITGPYLDRNGNNMINGGGNTFLITSANRIGPGHISVYSEGNADWFTYHYYDAHNAGAARLGIKRLSWDAQGWPIGEWQSIYRFETDARDDAHAFHGTLISGAAIARDGTRGNVLHLEGGAAHVLLPADASSGYSFALWVKRFAGPPSQRILEFRADANRYLYLTASGRFALTTTGAAGERFLQTSQSLPTNKWTHLTVTLDGRTGKLYLDGNLVFENGNIGLLPEDIKATVCQVGKSFAGQIDDLMLTSRVLSAEEVRDLYRGPKLVHRYSFSEPPGSRSVVDSVGGAHGTVFGGGTFSAGRLTLNGVDAYVDLPNGLISKLTNATLEMWIAWQGSSAWQHVFDFGTNDNGENNQGTGTRYLVLTPRAFNSSGAARFGITTNSHDNEIFIASPSAYPSGQFVHVVISYNYSNGRMRYYLNGHRIGHGSATIPLNAIADVNNWLGKSNWAPDPYFAGVYDEFRIYDGAMEDADVSGSFAAGPGVIAGGSNAAIRLVPAGSIWRYSDEGVDLGTFWRGTPYNDSMWSVGAAQLGYGDNDEGTRVRFGPDPNQRYITTYFRHSWVVDDTTMYTNLQLRLLRDDGGVVYLNGQEVFRSNIGGTVTNLTLTSNAQDDGSICAVGSVSPTRLVPGTNVLAVEIHQTLPTSSDLSFDLELLGYPRLFVPPRLNISRENNGVVLSWPATFKGFALETAPTLEADWVPSTIPVLEGPQYRATNDVTGPMRLFRLRQ